ncbi:UNVERIFIED_CONTAM: hypothetical protein Sindi_0937900 [Sesamum indicum]
MELNEIHYHERNQILMMGPMPGVSRAYAMILRVEKQKEEQRNTSQNMAMQVYKKPEFQKKFQRKKNFPDKRLQICKECGKLGHLKEACFEIHGYPDWYKTLMELKKGTTLTTNKVAAAIDMKITGTGAVDGKAKTEMLRTEFHKFLGGLKPQTLTITDEDRYDFFGKTAEPDSFNTRNSNTWIIDSGSTSHMRMMN